MNIGIIGLGLIGGSMAKAIKTHTEHTVYGCDKIESIQLRAKMVEAIDDLLTPALLKKCDIILIALFPDATVAWLKENASKIRRDAMVFDCCGNKQQVCEAGFELAEKHGFTFSVEAEDFLREGFGKMAADLSAGNGRICRNIVEDAILNYAIGGNE